MENMVIKGSFWKNKSVFLTGHTGFKGGWLAHWLAMLGAKVHGFSLDPCSGPSFYEVTNLKERIFCSTIGDIRDFEKVSSAIKKSNADILIHMAAQPIVRLSYNNPLETISTNVIGTANVLESARYSETIRAIVNITTDKCYENKEWQKPYKEEDRLGGYDPYSSSKACAELVSTAFRNSFLHDANKFIASVRAGNVIGGGDWAIDRLIPDFFRSIDSGNTLMIRSPNSIRPWQHVLEPLYGYMLIAENLFEKGESFSEAWNFGPRDEDSKSVKWIIDKLCELTMSDNWKIDDSNQPHEAVQLKLDSTKAMSRLDWSPRWNIKTALDKTFEWHQSWKNGDNMEKVTNTQISTYSEYD